MNNHYETEIALTQPPRPTNALYWAAGFLEGEGSFMASYVRGGSKGGHKIVAVQVQREPLERLCALFGGNLRQEKRGEWRWQIFGPRAIGICMTLYALMSPRRQGQIRKVLDEWKNRPGRGNWGRKTTCCRGHLFSHENTYVHPQRGTHHCKACAVILAKRRAA